MVPAFLAELRSRDVEVWADGDHLRCAAPAGVLTLDLRNQLQQRKSEILEFLRSATALAQQQRAIVPLQPRGTRAPVFGVAGHNGDVFCYRALAAHLGDEQPFFGLQPPGLDGLTEPLASVADLAAYFAGQIRAFQPDGPYVIAGYCAGGAIAFELARQLLQQRAAIACVALFGCPHPAGYRRLPQIRRRLVQLAGRLSHHAREVMSRPLRESHLYLTEKLRQHTARPDDERAVAPDPVLVLRAKVERATLAALPRYAPGHFAGRVNLFLPSRELGRDPAMLRWRSVAQRTETYFGPDGCDGDAMLREPYAPRFAELLELAQRH
jgi:thioesterase domain-containing protein